MVSGQLSEWTLPQMARSQMDTIPNRHYPYEHYPEWTQSRMDIISNGHYPEWIYPEWTPSGKNIPNEHIPNEHIPMNTSRMDTIPNEDLHIVAKSCLCLALFVRILYSLQVELSYASLFLLYYVDALNNFTEIHQLPTACSEVVLGRDNSALC